MILTEKITIVEIARMLRELAVRVTATLTICFVISGFVHAQAVCGEGGTLDTATPKGMSVDTIIQKTAEQENKVRDARSRYSFTQDVLVQTLSGTAVDGQWHQITQVSHDDKGKRLDNVTYSEQPTLRQIQLSPEDLDDIRTFMPWVLTSDQVSEYKFTFAGQQHVDDLDTYVFQVEPKTIEKKKRYFQGRIWIDNRDLQIVKLCGKSVPEQLRAKKHQSMDIRPTFAGYRQYVDGYWFPAYARVDDTLQIGVDSVHVREIVKFKDYKRAGSTGPAKKP